MINLNSAINKPSIDGSTRQEIVRNLWPPSSSIRDDLDLEPYFRYYIRQCHNAVVDLKHHVLTRTHQDIVDIVHQIEQGNSRDVIKDKLRDRIINKERSTGPNEDEILNVAIDLAARLHLMTNISCDNHFNVKHMQIEWRSDTLESHLADHYAVAPILGDSGVTLDRLFTVANLERIAGFQIKLTDNLADHLRLIDEEDQVVAIFHHASFLNRQTR